MTYRYLCIDCRRTLVEVLPMGKPYDGRMRLRCDACLRRRKLKAGKDGGK